MGKITTGSGLGRKAYMAAYNKGVNRSPSVSIAKEIGLSSEARKAMTGTADPGEVTQGSPGVGSVRDYGKPAIAGPAPSDKGGVTQAGGIGIPEAVALFSPAKGKRGF